PPESEPAPPAPSRRRGRVGVAIGAISVAVLPVVTAAIGAIHGHWVPTGDDASLAERASDVFTRHSPLLGAQTSLGIYAPGKSPQPAGPMLYWAMAGPDWLLQKSPSGIVIAIALVNVASIIGIGVVAWRMGRASAVLLAMTAVTIMTWSLGQQL